MLPCVDPAWYHSQALTDAVNDQRLDWVEHLLPHSDPAHPDCPVIVVAAAISDVKFLRKILPRVASHPLAETAIDLAVSRGHLEHLGLLWALYPPSAERAQANFIQAAGLDHVDILRWIHQQVPSVMITPALVESVHKYADASTAYLLPHTPAIESMAWVLNESSLPPRGKEVMVNLLFAALPAKTQVTVPRQVLDAGLQVPAIAAWQARQDLDAHLSGPSVTPAPRPRL